MASTSSSTPSNPVTLSSTLSLPKSCTSYTANKIENLVEYSYIPESAQSVSHLTLSSALISYTNAPIPLPEVSVLSSLLDGLTLTNISSLLTWTNVLFKQPLLSNMLLWKSLQSSFPIGKGKDTLISILGALD